MLCLPPTRVFNCASARTFRFLPVPTSNVFDMVGMILAVASLFLSFVTSNPRSFTAVKYSTAAFASSCCTATLTALGAFFVNANDCIGDECEREQLLIRGSYRIASALSPRTRSHAEVSRSRSLDDGPSPGIERLCDCALGRFVTPSRGCARKRRHRRRV